MNEFKGDKCEPDDTNLRKGHPLRVAVSETPDLSALQARIRRNKKMTKKRVGLLLDLLRCPAFGPESMRTDDPEGYAWLVDYGWIKPLPKPGGES